MDPDEISQLCENLSIEESDGLVVRMERLVYAEGKE